MVAERIRRSTFKLLQATKILGRMASPAFRSKVFDNLRWKSPRLVGRVAICRSNHSSPVLPYQPATFYAWFSASLCNRSHRSVGAHSSLHEAQSSLHRSFPLHDVVTRASFQYHTHRPPAHPPISHVFFELPTPKLFPSPQPSKCLPSRMLCYRLSRLVLSRWSQDISILSNEIPERDTPRSGATWVSMQLPAVAPHSPETLPTPLAFCHKMHSATEILVHDMSTIRAQPSRCFCVWVTGIWWELAGP